MASISLFLSLSLLTSLLFSCSMAITSPHNRTSYIRTSCSHTLYPALCYASLSPYAHRVGTNPVLLSRFAMNVTLARLKSLSLRQRAALAPSYSYSSGNGNGNGNGSSTPILKDNCGDLISHATDLVRNSEKEVTGLEEKVGPEVMWRISNAQTWLSAALTYEETCTDEIEEEGSGGTSTGKGEDVEQLCRKLKRVKQLTSNALALVNCLVN